MQNILVDAPSIEARLLLDALASKSSLIKTVSAGAAIRIKTLLTFATALSARPKRLARLDAAADEGKIFRVIWLFDNGLRSM